MKTLSVALIVMIAGSTAAHAAMTAGSSKPFVTENVVFTSYDSKDGTYGGFVRVQASPCEFSRYDIEIPVAGAKNAFDAMAKVQAQIDKISSDVTQAKDRCH